MPNCDDGAPDNNGEPTERASGGQPGKRSLIDRRSYLTAAAATAAAPIAATATASAATARGGIDFDRTVDAVDDLGCDPTGARACQDRIAAAATDGTLVEVPSGTYRVDGNLAVRGAQNVGIVGDGDVTFAVPADSQVQFGFEDVTEGLFAGVTVDQRAPGAVARTRFGCAGGTLRVRDVTVRGATASVRDGAGFRLVPVARDPDATVVVERFAAPDGGPSGSYAAGGGGVYAGPAHVGTLRLVDCDVAGHPHGGAHLGRANGTVRVEGGRYANNEVAQARLGGPDATLEGATLAAGRGERTDAALVVEGGAVDVRDAAIRCDVDAPAVRAAAPSGDGAGALRLVDSQVAGAAAGGAAVRVRDRPGTVIRDSCVHGTGADRDGVALVGCADATVSDTVIDVTGEPLVVRASSVDTADVSFDDDCSHGAVAPAAIAEQER